MLRDDESNTRYRAAIALMGQGGLIEMVARGTSATGVVGGEGTAELAKAVDGWLTAPDKAAYLPTVVAAVESIKDLPTYQASAQVAALWDALQSARRNAAPEALAAVDQAAGAVSQLRALRRYGAVQVLEQAIKDQSQTPEIRRYAAIAIGISADPSAARTGVAHQGPRLHQHCGGGAFPDG